MVRWFLSITLPCTRATRNAPAVASPGHPPPSPPSVWGPARGASDGKWLFLGKWLLAASLPPTAARGRGVEVCQHPAGRETATISRRARGGCVGWKSFSGARRLAGLASKTSLDVRRWGTTLIYSYSFFTYSCVTASPPVGPSEENPAVLLGAASGSGPNSNAAGAAFFLSQ